ncbi:FAR1-related sequence 5-like protein [Tanacetum coccineum]
MVTRVPSQEGTEGNVAEKKKVIESMKANLGKLLKYNAWSTRWSSIRGLFLLFIHASTDGRGILKIEIWEADLDMSSENGVNPPAPNPSTNTNFSLLSVLGRERLTGPNYMDWMRNLRFTLRLESLNMAFDAELSINMILSGLPADYNQFVLSYQMNGKETSIMELHSLLQTAEQGIKKSDVPSTSAAPVLNVGHNAKKRKTSHSNWKGKATQGKSDRRSKRKVDSEIAPTGDPKEAVCFYCNTKGHWKHSCPKYLKDLKDGKVKKGGHSGMFMIELHNTTTSDSWVLDTGCGTHICTVLQGLKESRKLKHGELNLGSWETESHACDKDWKLDESKLWHSRLRDINKKCIAQLQKDGVLESFDFKSDDACVSCILSEMTKSPFTRSCERGEGLLDLVHTYVCGPFRSATKDGKRYYVTFTDDFSRYGYVYLIKHKSDTFEVFKRYQTQVENQLGRKIKVLRSDRGGEYLSIEFFDHLKNCGIVSQLSPPRTPQLNGVAKRRNRTLLDMKVSKTHFETWKGKRPSLGHIKIWGCEVFVRREAQDKLEARSEKCLFVDYPEESFGYLFYIPKDNVVFVARRGTFLEREMISKEDSGSKIDLEEIQESIDEEPIDPQFYYGFHIEEDKISDSTLIDLNEPANYKEAMACPEAAKWKEAMKSEIQSMYNNQVWNLVDTTPGLKIVGCKWIFKKKTDMDGKVHTYKARLVAKGYTQTHGIDYEETFSPVAKIKSIRIMLAIAAKVSKRDREPTGQKDKVKLLRTIPHLNMELLRGVFLEREMIYKEDSRSKIHLEEIKESVDEEPIISKDLCPKTDDELDRMSRVPYASAVGSIMYAMTCTRPDVSFALSMVSRHQQNLGEGHWTAVKNILKYLRNTKDRFLVNGGEEELRVTAVTWKSSKQDTVADFTCESEYIAACKASKEAIWMKNFIGDLGVVPTVQDLIEIFGDSESAVALTKNPRITETVGSVMCTMVYTRPAIAHAVEVVSRFMSNPGREHWEAVKWLLRYLKGTSKATLCLNRKEVALEGFYDSDYGGCLDSGKSTTGYVFTGVVQQLVGCLDFKSVASGFETKVMRHRSHNKFHRSMACKSLMVKLGKSGLRPCQVRKAVNAMKSPNEPTITSKQCVDILAEERKQYKGKEFDSLIKHLQEKAAIDVNQYFKIDLFDDGSPRNIFWDDGRSRDAYLKFGDVVVFDVTYLTNKFKFPFSPLVGVNHHGQSIIFGGALLENEKEKTFKWLFKQFLKCMFNKCPSVIITYQDKAICNEVKHVFPNTRHRYCAWHIKKHVLEHPQPFRVRYSDFQVAFKQWVRSDTVEDFESQWLSTLEEQLKAEEDEDFKTMNSRPVLSSIHPIEAKAGKLLLSIMFQPLFCEQTTIEATTNLTHETKSKSEEKSSYWVGRVNVDKKYWRIINFCFVDDLDVTCSCAMYKGGNASIGIEETNSENGVSALALWYVQANLTKAIEQARDAPFEIKRLNSFLVEFLEDQMIRGKPTEIENTYKVAHVGISLVDMMPQISVRDPAVLTILKGRPRNATRVKPPIEVKQMKTITCSYCRKPGHNITGYREKKAASMQEKK